MQFIIECGDVIHHSVAFFELSLKSDLQQNVVMLYIIHIKILNSDEEMLYNITTFSNSAQKCIRMVYNVTMFYK
jgi:hypothetical protein